jgi:hypothetical protein
VDDDVIDIADAARCDLVVARARRIPRRARIIDALLDRAEPVGERRLRGDDDRVAVDIAAVDTACERCIDLGRHRAEPVAADQCGRGAQRCFGIRARVGFAHTGELRGACEIDIGDADEPARVAGLSPAVGREPKSRARPTRSGERVCADAGLGADAHEHVDERRITADSDARRESSSVIDGTARDETSDH